MSKTKQRRVTKEREHSKMFLLGMQDYMAYLNKKDNDNDELWSKVGKNSPYWKTEMAYRSGWYRYELAKN